MTGTRGWCCLERLPLLIDTICFYFPSPLPHLTSTFGRLEAAKVKVHLGVSHITVAVEQMSLCFESSRVNGVDLDGLRKRVGDLGLGNRRGPTLCDF